MFSFTSVEAYEIINEVYEVFNSMLLEIENDNTIEWIDCHDTERWLHCYIHNTGNELKFYFIASDEIIASGNFEETQEELHYMQQLFTMGYAWEYGAWEYGAVKVSIA